MDNVKERTAVSQKVVSEVSVEGSTEAEGGATPLAVQLEIDPPAVAVILQAEADACLQQREHGGQPRHLHRVCWDTQDTCIPTREQIPTSCYWIEMFLCRLGTLWGSFGDTSVKLAVSKGQNRCWVDPDEHLPLSGQGHLTAHVLVQHHGYRLDTRLLLATQRSPPGHQLPPGEYCSV